MEIKKIAILIIMIIEMLCFTGEYYGYNSLIPIYKDKGVFSQYCDETQANQTTTCHTQDIYFGRAFVTWLFIQAFSNFILGIAFDKFGIIFMKVVAAACFMAGFVCLAFTPTVNWLLFIGGALLTMCAHCVAVANISLSILYSPYSNLVMSVQCSLYDVSAIMMTFIKFLTNAGSPFWLLCLGYGGIGFIVILGSIFFLKSQAENILVKKKNACEENEEAEQGQQCKETNTETPSTVSIEDLYANSMEKQFPTLKTCFYSFQYLSHLAFFLILCFRFTFYLAQMASQLAYLFPTNPQLIDHLLSVSNLFWLGSLVIGPGFGLFMDKYRSYISAKLAQHSDLTPKQVYSQINACFMIPSCICSTVMVIASALMFIPNQYVFYIVFICMTITRALLFSINSAYIFSALPKKYFGTLIGSEFLIAGLINLSQQLILPFASPVSHPHIVNYIMLALCALSFGHGFYLKFKK